METTTMGVPPARTVEAGRGVNWWTDAVTLFMKNPGMWIVLGLVLIVILTVLNFVPMLGGAASALLTPVFGGSWMLALRKQETGGALEVGDLFLGFKDALNPLLVLGALSLAAAAVLFVMMWGVGIGAFMGMGTGAMHRSGLAVLAAAGAGMFAVLVALALIVPITMAFWFAPALVVFDGVAPVEALKSSFSACLRNLLPFLVYGALGLVATIVASIPAMLGWLLLLPLTGHSVYLSYRDIYAR